MPNDITLSIPQSQKWHQVRFRHGAGLVFVVLLLEAALVACAFVVVEQLLGGGLRFPAEFGTSPPVLVALVYFALKAVAVLFARASWALAGTPWPYLGLRPWCSW